jgi:hypothetical protein
LEQREDITWRHVPFAEPESIYLAGLSSVKEQFSYQEPNKCSCVMSAHSTQLERESLDDRHSILM